MNLIKITKLLLQPALSGTRGKPQARGLVPGDLGSSECEDIKHFDITPEAFQASELEFDEDETIIERILFHNNEQLNKSNLKTFNETVTRPVLESSKQGSQPDMTASISPYLTHQTSTIPILDNQLNCKENTSEVNQTAGRQSFPNVPSTSSILSSLETSLPADIPCIKSFSNSQLDQSEISQTNPVISGFMNSAYPIQFPNSSLIRPNSPTTPNSFENLSNLPASNFNCYANSSITSTKLPSLPHNVPTSSVQRSLQSTTLSQFTPKGTPFVSHAFHNLGPKALGPGVEALRYGTTGSTFSARRVSAPRDPYSNTLLVPLVVKSESQHLNPESSLNNETQILKHS